MSQESAEGRDAASAPAEGEVSSLATVERTDLPLLGMHCAACANRIEKALGRAPGVSQASVNFATARATVRYDSQVTDPESLREVVREAGYDAIAPQRVGGGRSSGSRGRWRGCGSGS